MKKIGCEKKYNYGNYNVVVGTLDKKNPWIFYIELSTYINYNNDDYAKAINILYENLSNGLRNYKLDNYEFDVIPNRNIVDIDVAFLNSKVGVRPHMTGKRFFCIKSNPNIHGFNSLFELLQPVINNSLIPLMTDYIQQEGFTTHKSKK